MNKKYLIPELSIISMSSIDIIAISPEDDFADDNFDGA